MATDKEIVIAILGEVASGVTIGTAYTTVTDRLGLGEKQAVTAYLAYSNKRFEEQSARISAGAPYPSDASDFSWEGSMRRAKAEMEALLAA